MNRLPILYSFRRCPYAMRARLALLAAGETCELREVELRNKPAEMLALSPKGTVPVLHLADGSVLDESLDIMNWALSKNDPDQWLPKDAEAGTASDLLIARADQEFKLHLDRYKYHGRYENADPMHHRAEGLRFLTDLDMRLSKTGHFFEGRITLAEMAIIPFVRQFANVDRDWFDGLALTHLQAWLTGHLNAELFQRIMVRHVPWTKEDSATLFP